MKEQGISWKEKRNKLAVLVKKLSDENGGDDIEWLKGYFEEVLKEYTNNLDLPILACESLFKEYQIQQEYKIQAKLLKL